MSQHHHSCLKQALLWEQTQPQKHIIIAASTATYPSMQKLAKTIYHLPKGEIILYGLDKLLDTNAWKAIDESHPQYGLPHTALPCSPGLSKPSVSGDRR